MKYYVYRLIDPRDGSTFYVGKGCGDRMYHHAKEAVAGRQSRKCDRIREIGLAGLSVVYEVDSRHVDELEAYAREAELIEAIGLYRLTNIQRGGGGVRKGIPSYSEWMEDRRALRGVADLLKRAAIAGGDILLAGVSLKKMASKYLVDTIRRHGFQRVEGEMARYMVHLRNG